MPKVLLLGEGKAEAEEVVPVVREVVETVRRATEPRVAVPAAATAHAVRPTVSTRRVGLCCAAVISVPILTPFPYISAHII